MKQFEVTEQKPILFSEESYGGKSVAVIELNRPQVLNALNTECYKLLEPKLLNWQTDNNIAAVVIHTRNEKSFCAGGDVKDLVLKMREQGLDYAKDFFTREYFVDHLIHKYRKPVIVFADGITMGAGLGIMNGASHRVVTERTVLSMPEQGIGLFPDVGATFFLQHPPQHFGLFMGLTAARVSGADAVHIGLADFYMESKNKRRVMADILKLNLTGDLNRDNETLNHYFSRALMPPPEAKSFADYKAYVAEPFSQALKNKDAYSSIAQIIAEIKSDSVFLQDCKKRFLSGSPTSKLAFFAAYFRHTNYDITQTFIAEWEMALRFSKETEFHEGVRALLIDKDNQPKWSPAKESEVTNIERVFQSGEKNLLKEKIENLII